MSDETLAIDPGLNAPGGAVFRDHVLVRAGPIRIPRSLTKLDLVARCREVSRLICEWYIDGRVVFCEPSELVFERPQVYAPGKSNADPNDLPPMLGIDVGVACRWPNVPVTSYLPREWTGQRPKEESGPPWDSPRGMFTWARLTPLERELCATLVITHDVVDSIGVGLFHLGRYQARRW